MFFLTVVFGLFHGLVYLPVLLSLIGPTHSVVSKRKREESAALSQGGTDSDVISEDSYFAEAGLRGAKRGYAADNVGGGVDDVRAIHVGGGIENGGYVHDEVTCVTCLQFDKYEQ